MASTWEWPALQKPVLRLGSLYSGLTRNHGVCCPSQDFTGNTMLYSHPQSLKRLVEKPFSDSSVVKSRFEHEVTAFHDLSEGSPRTGYFWTIASFLALHQPRISQSLTAKRISGTVRMMIGFLETMLPIFVCDTLQFLLVHPLDTPTGGTTLVRTPPIP